jgi:2-aminoadipate transaminase
MNTEKDFKGFFSNRISHMRESVIREILKVVSLPGMISLAGGIPSPESFPMDIIQELTSSVIKKYSTEAFQYNTTEGFLPLREALTSYLAKTGIKASSEEICITSGSQGCLDTIGMVLISEGDKIAVESPTYLGSLQAFNPYGPEYVTIDMDDDGLIPSSLEKVLKEADIKLIYLAPTFQNPTGRTTTLERRKKIASIIKEHHALLIEDDPYSALRYRGEKIPTIREFAPDNVIYISTLSKVFAPGLRIGFYVAPAEIRHWLTIAKQGVDLHTSTFNQALAAEYISGGYLERHLPKIIDIYKPKQEAMLNAMEKYFPESCKWSRPEGGMFIWVEGPEGMDMLEIYKKCIERKAAFVPGKYFFAIKGEGEETMRLNFTRVDEDLIEKAVKIIGDVIKQES